LKAWMRWCRACAAATASGTLENSSSMPSPRLFTSRPPRVGRMWAMTSATKARQRWMVPSSSCCIRRTDSTTSTNTITVRIQPGPASGASCAGRAGSGCESGCRSAIGGVAAGWVMRDGVVGSSQRGLAAARRAVSGLCARFAIGAGCHVVWRARQAALPPADLDACSSPNNPQRESSGTP